MIPIEKMDLKSTDGVITVVLVVELESGDR